MLKRYLNTVEFVAGTVRRELALRRQGVLLGSVWPLAVAVMTVALYAVIFSRLMGSRLPSGGGVYDYVIYLCAGMLVWNVFSEVISKSVTMLIDNAGLIKKVKFGHLAIPLTVVVMAVYNALPFFLVFVGFTVLAGSWHVGLMALPLVVLLAAWLAAGIGVLLAILNVFFRDASQVLPVLLQLMFWTSPVVYPMEILPDEVRNWICWNPIARLVELSQRMALWPQKIDLWLIVYPVCFGIVVMWAARRIYNRCRSEVLDIL